MSDTKFICPKCKQEIAIDFNLYNSGQEQKIVCVSCGAKLMLKKSVGELAKDAAKSLVKGLGKLCLEGLKCLVNEANPDTINERMGAAYEKLDTKHIDHWDKERLEREFRATNNLYEKQIIFNRMKEYDESDIDD